MPTITLRKKRLLKLLGRKINMEDLSYAISMIGTDVKEVNEENIIVEVFPNRPDMLSEEGFARALRYYLEFDDELKLYEVKGPPYKGYAEKEALLLRPYIAGAIVKNVKNFDEEAFESIINLQEKLHITHGRKRKVASIGVHNLNKIKFPIYYKAVNRDFSFTPLGWDKEASIDEILRNHEKGKEYGHLLEGKKVPIWVDDKGDVLALPPIINGSITAISPNTQDFFIDVTGTNEKAVKDALNIMVTHLLELGGEVYSFEINNNTHPDLNYKRKKVSLDYVNSLLGLNLNITYVEELLLRMGIGLEKISNKEFYALIPPYRTDIIHPMDIVEDIGIAYGYDKFEEKMPEIFTPSSISGLTKFENILREIFIGMKAQEIMTYHLSNDEILYKKMMLPTKGVKVIHPMNEEYDTLRDSLIPVMLDFMSKNKRYEYMQFIFEIGNVFIRTNDGFNEEIHLGWLIGDTKIGFEDAKALMDALMRELGITYKVDNCNLPFFINGRSVKILINDNEIGIFGEIHPQVIKNFNLEVPIIGGEVNVEKLFEEKENS